MNLEQLCSSSFYCFVNNSYTAVRVIPILLCQLLLYFSVGDSSTIALMSFYFLSYSCAVEPVTLITSYQWVLCHSSSHSCTVFLVILKLSHHWLVYYFASYSLILLCQGILYYFINWSYTSRPVTCYECTLTPLYQCVLCYCASHSYIIVSIVSC